MIQIHYGKKRKPFPKIQDIDLYLELSSDDMEVIEVEDIDLASDEVVSLLENGDGKTVYVLLLKFNDGFDRTEFKIESEIYISHNSLMASYFLTSHLFLEAVGSIFLFEYHSYEAAYEIALDLREVNELCYE
jgi:hypothetical protein